MTKVDDKRLEAHRLKLIRQACAWIEVKTEEGDLRVGIAFHIGNGIYMTARNLVENNEIVQINPLLAGHNSEDDFKFKIPAINTLVAGDVPARMEPLSHNNPKSNGQLFFHPDSAVDVAALVVYGIDENTPHLILSGPNDMLMNRKDWLLTYGTAIGFPSSPKSEESEVKTTEVEVNSVLKVPNDRYTRIVVSSDEDGSFSGGPVFHEMGFLLGMITENLEIVTPNNDRAFLIVLSLEPLRDCLKAHDLLPDFQQIEKSLKLN